MRKNISFESLILLQRLKKMPYHFAWFFFHVRMYCYLIGTYLPLAGVRNPVGVLGRDPPFGVVVPNLLALAAARA